MGASWDDPVVSTGWRCLVVSPFADSEDWATGGVELEQLDPAGVRWSASVPSGKHVGGFAGVLATVAQGNADRAWLEAVAKVVKSDSAGELRSGLVVRRTEGVWFHTTFVENRDSILPHGLGWRRFVGSGIAGSRSPETEGIFLCADIESAEFFVHMGERRGRGTDIWAVALDGQRLISDPSSSGELDDSWMICLQPIPADALRLCVPCRSG